MPCSDTGFVHWELNPRCCDHLNPFAGWHKHSSRSRYILSCSGLLSVYLGHLLQQPLRQGASKMEDIKMWTDVSQVKGFGLDQAFFGSQPTKHDSRGCGNSKRTWVPVCLSHITATFHPCLHSTVLHTKCNFINLHASIHIDIHEYVWTLHFTAPSIWKIQKKVKHWLYI